MRSILYINSFRCRMWALHDRFDAHVSEETCRTEIDSFSRHGQLVPVLGRPLHGDPDHDIELIYGARRLFVARHINKPLAVDVREITDREAIVAMDIENRQRSDISPFERGMSYARWLRSGYFQSQDDIARELRISASQVSRLLKLARLPAVIVDAFSSPIDICEGWGLDLIEALDDPQRRQLTVSRARALSHYSPRQPAREVYRQLLSASAPGRKLKKAVHDEVVKDHAGEPLFRIRQHSNSIALLFPVEKTSAEMLDSIRSAIRHILLDANLQPADFHHQDRAQHDAGTRAM